MPADLRRLRAMQAIEQPLVVGEVKALLLQLPLAIPVHLREEREVSGARDRGRPELSDGALPEQIDRVATCWRTPR